jgi:spore coat polysaccharide biosynthesis predicted glycosyltransferase SpsG
MQIEIITGGSPELGFGHLKRSDVLGKHLKDYGHTILLSDVTAMIFEPEELFDLPRVNCRIFDLPPQLEKDFSKKSFSQDFSVSLDGMEMQSDLNFSIFRHANSKSIRSYSGYDFAIISNDFLNFKAGHHDPSTSFSNVCICLGGGDILGQGPIIAERLCALGFNVVLVCGPFVTYKIDDISPGVNVVVRPSNINDLFQKADWVVANGGGTLFEALCMGKPAISCPQTNLEEVIARDLLDKGALLGLGLDDALHPNFSKVNEVSRVAMETIDGKGKDRIRVMIEQAVSVV